MSDQANIKSAQPESVNTSPGGVSDISTPDMIQDTLVLVKLQKNINYQILQLSNRSLLARLSLSTASVEARLEDLEVVTMEGLGGAVEVVEAET